MEGKLKEFEMSLKRANDLNKELEDINNKLGKQKDDLQVRIQYLEKPLNNLESVKVNESENDKDNEDGYECDVSDMLDVSDMEIDTNGRHSKRMINRNLKCDICKMVFRSRSKINKHMESKHNEEGDWRCDSCPFQINNPMDLRKHVEHTHHTSNLLEHIAFECKLCVEKFPSRNQLSLHTKEKHKTYKPCIKFPLNKCEFGNACLFNHIQLNENEHICYKCGNIFRTKYALMTHIKSAHGNVPCNKFSQSQCRFTNESCLFSHAYIRDASNIQSKSMSKSQDFPILRQSSAPPDWPHINHKQNRIQSKARIRFSFPR